MFKTLDLPGGALMPFSSVPGKRVRILYGRIWLTEEGSPRDAFLASGEEVSLDKRGLAVIEALGPARIQLIEPIKVRLAIATAIMEIVQRVAAWWPSPRRSPKSFLLRPCRRI